MPFNYQKQPVKAKPVDETASRVWDTDYQNTSGRPLLVIVDARCFRAGVAGACAYLEGRIGTSSPCTLVVGRDGLNPQDNNEEEMRTTFIFIVPNNYYYRVNEFPLGEGSLCFLWHWWEVEL